jgi:hypothetical protein
LRIEIRLRKASQATLNDGAIDWLARPRDQRWLELLKHVPWGIHGKQEHEETFNFLGNFPLHPFPYAAYTNNLPQFIQNFFSQLTSPTDLFRSSLHTFHYHNPFIFAMDDNFNLRGLWSHWGESSEDVYARIVFHALRQWVSLGALALHLDRQGALGLSLTDAGRWILGLTKEFDPKPQSRKIAILSGDYTLTLLESAPELTSMALAFAEPVSPTTFKITKSSIQKAAHQGLGVEGIWAGLEPWLKQDIPQNVRIEVAGWAKAKSTIRISQALLIEGDDPHKMAELLTEFPKIFSRVSETILKADGATRIPALVKKLEKKGVFLGN